MTLFAVVLVAPEAAAQRAPVLDTGVSTQDVEVGRPFSMQLSAMVDATDRVPDKPTLQTPPGIVVRAGPSVMPKTQVTLNGPNLIQQMGVVVTWTLEATRPGTYRIGPPSVMWAGKRHTGSLVLVRAHRRGSLPQPKVRDPFDMFDIFGLPKLPGLFDHPRYDEPLLPPTDPSLAMSEAPARVVFLRAMLDKKQAVLGEQVTLSVYEYRQTSALRRIEVREPSAPDFLQHPVLDPAEEPGTQYADVGSSVWKVRLIRKIALFPLRSGDLAVEPMQVVYAGRGLRSNVMRQTRPVSVRIVQAPARGRPVGYRDGDVGRFSLDAEVEPRTTEAGGAVAVRVKLQGSGNFPTTLPTPSGKGIEWLDPETRDSIDEVNGEIRGERVFTYVVRLRTPGKVDLGRIELPYYDPDRKRYEVASADLGAVTVIENPNAPAVPAERDRFSDLDAPRATLGSYVKPGGHVTDSPWYWLVLIASPLTVALFGAGFSLLRRVRASARAWRDSLERHAKVSLSEAKRAVKEGKPADAASSIERAVHASIERATGLKSRGILRASLHDALTGEGLDAKTADRTVELLASLESLRFDPEADEARAQALIEEGQALVRTLAKPRKGSK